MPTSTVENYLKQIYIDQPTDEATMMPMGRLASAVGVTPGTATAMIKTMTESDLVVYEPRTGVRLSPEGESLALQVLRRHRLVELWLVEILGLDWSEVHEEAEVLEHAISDKVLARIDALLGHPTVDPHGDPIPTADGDVVARAHTSLPRCETDKPLRIVRIADQDPEFLTYADQNGLVPGARLIVERRDRIADAVTIRVGGHDPITLGTSAAERLLVEPADGQTADPR
ncbi:MAG: DtxR family transcriptional regulator [Phycisphaerae bacterium]|nr:DtxR family transcriptional regulator [Phycisphaerae bacterium]